MFQLDKEKSASKRDTQNALLIHLYEQQQTTTPPPEMYRNALKFQEHLAKLPQAMFPRFVDNKWRKPEFSARRVAELRKKALQENVEWTFDAARKPEKFPRLKPPKGHKRLRDREVKLRDAKREAAEKRQPEIARLYEEKRRRRAKGDDAVLDQVLLSRREKTMKMRTITTT